MHIAYGITHLKTMNTFAYNIYIYIYIYYIHTHDTCRSFFQTCLLLKVQNKTDKFVVVIFLLEQTDRRIEAFQQLSAR
jgi:hypothetical protein